MLANVKTLTFSLVAAIALMASASAYAGNGFGNFPGGGIQFNNGHHHDHHHHHHNGNGGIVPPHLVKKKKFIQPFPFQPFPQFHDGHFHNDHFHNGHFHGNNGGGIHFHFGK